MGGLFNPPPGPTTPGVPLPIINVPNFVSTGQAVAEGAAQSTFIDDLIAKWRASKGFSFHLVWETLAAFIVEAVASWVKLYTQLQATDNPGLWDLLAAVVEDVIGVPVNGAAIRGAYKHTGRGGALTQAGAALFNSLEQSIATQSGAVTALSGYASARAFAGWIMELSIRQGNTALFTSMIPEEYRMMEGVVEYGEQLSKNMGFGRLARRAFQPLIDAVVAKPLTWSMNATYRPTLLSEGQVIKLFHANVLDQATATQILTYHGYNDADIARLLQADIKPIGLHYLLDLVRAGVQDAGGVVPLIQQEGYNQTDANLIWQAAQEAALSGAKNHLISTMLHQLTQGFIDLPTFTTTTDSMNLLPVERSYWQLIAQQIMTYPRKHLSEAEVEKAYVDGLIDISTAQGYWISLGYSPTSIQILTLLLLQKQQGGTKTTAGHVGRKLLTEAEIEKAFKAGIISMSQAQAYWTAHGYTPTDIQILTQLLFEAAKQPISPVSGTPT